MERNARPDRARLPRFVLAVMRMGAGEYQLGCRDRAVRERSTFPSAAHRRACRLPPVSAAASASSSRNAHMRRGPERAVLTGRPASAALISRKLPLCSVRNAPVLTRVHQRCRMAFKSFPPATPFEGDGPCCSNGRRRTRRGRIDPVEQIRQCASMKPRKQVRRDDGCEAGTDVLNTELPRIGYATATS